MSELNETNPAAFPLAVSTDFQYAEPGMTLRDWFASQAIPEAVTDYGRNNEHPHKKGDRLLPHECKALGSREDIIARQAYRYADAMLKAREAQS